MGGNNPETQGVGSTGPAIQGTESIGSQTSERGMEFVKAYATAAKRRVEETLALTWKNVSTAWEEMQEYFRERGGVLRVMAAFIPEQINRAIMAISKNNENITPRERMIHRLFGWGLASVVWGIPAIYHGEAKSLIPGLLFLVGVELTAGRSGNEPVRESKPA